MTFLLERKKSALAGKTAKLDAMDPLSVLSRGYAAAFSADGTVIKSTAQVEKGSDISLMLSDGTVKATVCDIVTNEEEKI